ncbi:DUF2141 domain-containing protein [Shewanella sp. GXUN23E]|uniref:DUF2141 domain-containing protein n=1 Tax=Shewanella sp. GXUN23E TaxID=3422498 RepID=UPI003D7EB364
MNKLWLLPLASTLSLSAQAANLTITMTDLPQPKGQLMVAVYDSAEAMKSGQQALARQTIAVHSNRHSMTLNDLPAGQYAVMVFQDLNANNRLDRNFIGIPSEPYGFSNNPSVMGAPDFEDIAFPLGEDDLQIRIRVE